jgi:hypothetical protein
MRAIAASELGRRVAARLTLRHGERFGEGVSMKLKPGARFRSAVDDTEVIVVKAPADDVDLRCGGHPVIDHTADRAGGAAVEPDHATGTLVGKRYVDGEATHEVLCTKGGDGGLSVGAVPLVVKDSKPLPSSD